MPRRSKGPRLYLDPSERIFVIRDGPRKRRTGCREDERPRAEIALRDYIAGEIPPYRRPPPRSGPRRGRPDILFSRDCTASQGSSDHWLRHRPAARLVAGPRPLQRQAVDVPRLRRASHAASRDRRRRASRRGSIGCRPKPPDANSASFVPRSIRLSRRTRP